MCAFANDINNWGGGYIIVGVDENEGQAVFPPIGLSQNKIDKLQGEVLNLAHQTVLIFTLLNVKNILKFTSAIGDGLCPLLQTKT